MINRYYKNRGETIIEVLIAVVISTMVLTAVFVLLNRAIDTNVNVRDRVIALNIAREGIEAVRNIRDTNWLKYAGDRRGKWLCHDVVGGDTCSTASVPLTDGDYVVDYDTINKRYYLVKKVAGLDLETATAAINNEYRLYVDATTERFTHDDDSGGNRATRFYREINIMIPALDTLKGSCVGNPASHCHEDKAKIIVLVEWLDGGVVRRSSLEHHLYDFYERDAYN